MRLLFALIPVLFPVAANAQPVSQPELERCAAIERAIERLDCFERLTARGQSLVSDPSQEGVVEPEPVATPQRASAPEIVESVPFVPPQPSPDEERTAAVVAPAEPGQEHLPAPRTADEAPQPDFHEVTVLEVTEGSRGNLYFHLDNGQIWRQIEARYVPYPADGRFEAVISRGFMGDYRLRVEGRGRLVRIRRMQ